MHSHQHPIWKLLTLIVLLLAVGGYMHVAYSHGFDTTKDGTLLGILGALAMAWNKITGGTTSSDNIKDSPDDSKTGER